MSRTNLERWKAHLTKKRYKFKVIENKWGTALWLRTCSGYSRCNVFISDKKIRFSFYNVRSKSFDNPKLSFTAKGSFTFIKRKDSLHIFFTDPKKGLRHMGLGGPMAFVTALTTFLSGPKGTKRPSKKIGYKITSLLEFYLKLSGFQIQEINKKSLLHLCYPGLKNVPLHPYLATRISRDLRRKDIGIHEACKKLFGHKSKILIKILLECGSDFDMIGPLGVAHALKPFLNRGQVEKLLTNPNRAPGLALEGQQVVPFRKFFRKFTVDQLLHLFTQEYSGYEISDALRQWEEFPHKIQIPKTVKNWEHVHNEISRQYRKLGEEDYEFKIHPKLKLIHGHKVEDAEIIVPHTRHELIDWGTKMNNCIAGYHRSFNSGQTVLLGIRKGNELLYNIEIRNKRILQFMANRNQRADEEIVSRWETVFKQFGLVA